MKPRHVITVFALLLSMVYSCKKGTEPTTPEPEPNTQNDITHIDTKVAEFMAKYSIPGLTLAVTKNEKLVYVKAYGMADTEAGENATATHLFRVGSVSKPITSIAIFKLIDEKKLTLDAKVFGDGAILGTTYGASSAYTANLKNITVRHLLNHTAGAWANPDPLSQQPALSKSEFLSWAINNYPVNRTPGTYFAYSNFGYFLLDQVIEKVSGKTYEEYVREAVLAPIGITTMQIGSRTLAARKPGEAKCYISGDAGDVDPYSENMNRIAAAGGWVSSAKDLVKLLTHADGFNGKKDILSAASITDMTTVPTLTNNTRYACGWTVAPPYWEHFGSISGGYSVLARNGKEGTNVAIIMNKRRIPAASFQPAVNALCWDEIATNTAIPWQDIDQF